MNEPHENAERERVAKELDLDRAIVDSVVDHYRPPITAQFVGGGPFDDQERTVRTLEHIEAEGGHYEFVAMTDHAAVFEWLGKGSQ